MTVIFLTEDTISKTDQNAFQLVGISLCRCGVRHHVRWMLAALCDV
jgi:hypothetical protein